MRWTNEKQVPDGGAHCRQEMGRGDTSCSIVARTPLNCGVRLIGAWRAPRLARGEPPVWRMAGLLFGTGRHDRRIVLHIRPRHSCGLQNLRSVGP